MSKEILFRGKSINTGNWVYGVPITSVNDKCYMVHGATEDAINTPNEIDFIFSEIDDNTIGQYIGKEDKKGKKIFIGDWVVCTRKYDDGSELNILRLIDDIRRLPEDLFGSSLKCLKVVGNVHDNPNFIDDIRRSPEDLFGSSLKCLKDQEVK